MGERGTGVGWSKLLLFGEHAAVYGYPAVGVALPWRCRVVIEPSDRPGWSVRDGAPGDEAVLQALLSIVEEAAREARPVGEPAAEHGGSRAGTGPPSGGRMTVASDVPRGLGFGSSAALCAALVRALSSLAGGDAGVEDQWRLSNRAESLFHGRPSGVDTGIALLRGLRAFHPAPPRLPRQRPLPGFLLSLVIGALPRRAPTRTLVEAVRRRLERDPAGTREKLERLGRLADGAIALLECETPVSRQARAGRGEPGGNCAGEGLWRPERLGELAVQAQGVLRELDLSTPELEEILKLGMRAGALGGKLSGAGGGGAFYLVAGDRPAALDLAERIEYCLRKHWRGTRAPFLAAAWCPVGRPGARSLRPIPG